MKKMGLRMAASAIMIGVLPSVALAALARDDSAGERLYLTAGAIDDERLLVGTHIMDTGVAGPTIRLTCNKSGDFETFSVQCRDDVGKVQISWSGSSVTPACMHRTAPPVPEPATDESIDVETQGDGSTEESNS